MKFARMMVVVAACAIGALAMGYVGCGGGGGSSSEPGSLGDLVACNSLTNEGCETGLSCEYVATGETGCFQPILLRGKVFDLATSVVIPDARVVALDANGSVASNVGITNADGMYELNVSAPRNADGTIADGASVTLRADAKTYQTFPGGVRFALPVDLTAAVVETIEEPAAMTVKSDQYALQTVQTDIALIALEAGAGTASIFGVVEMPAETAKGTLVVAELSATQGFTAIADITGAYRIFNLPAGAYTVKGYAQGVNYTPGAATLVDAAEAEVNLALSTDATATFNGSTQIVNPGDGTVTSVILVVESTFNNALARGEMPPGLRAPEGGIAPNVDGAFTITGVPTGTYVVLAAYENDFLVRDPDTCISGTDLIHQTFSAGQVLDMTEGFKITGSLNVISPGATVPEAVVGPNPTFTWEDDSSEDEYVIRLLDTFGNEIWTKSIVGVSGGTPSVTYDGATVLETGMYYQFRVTSKKDGCELSQTEDMKGVFYLQ